MSQSLSVLHALTQEALHVPGPLESTAPELEPAPLLLLLELEPSAPSPPLLDPESLATEASVPPSRNFKPSWTLVDPPQQIATSETTTPAAPLAVRILASPYSGSWDGGGFRRSK